MNTYRPDLATLNHRVLIIEDEYVLRELMCELVEDFGAEPIGLPTADEGLRYLEQHATQIGLVITNVRMPGLLDGHQLTRLIAQRWPALPVVVTSGYDGEQTRSLPQNACFLAKPWGAGQFTALIQPHLQR
ncbi:response regulator [Pseudomonas sp. 102515]|uniref:response regulator n=1 Tax=Pseudomonas sp. 102515 TaxID=3071568 RepID=UPI00280188A1|nr:response regulator [Pseudomonas sp. 102515]MDQ7915820.1 response regulator [Pseudomonas sp. 102515]